MLKDEQNGLHSKSEIYWYCSYKRPIIKELMFLWVWCSLKYKAVTNLWIQNNVTFNFILFDWPFTSHDLMILFARHDVI